MQYNLQCYILNDKSKLAIREKFYPPETQYSLEITENQGQLIWNNCSKLFVKFTHHHSNISILRRKLNVNENILNLFKLHLNIKHIKTQKPLLKTTQKQTI